MVPLAGHGAAPGRSGPVFLAFPGTTPVSDDDRLHPRLGRIRRDGGVRAPRLFKAQVLAVAQAGGHVGRTWPGRASTRRPGSGRGRGGVAAWRAAERHLSGGNRGRRVIVKARVVRQGFRTRAGSLRAHLAYLRREGVTRDGSRVRLFNAAGDDADASAFARRAEGDRHHFRFIVSPEDAAEMGDLRAFTRELAGQMERDLGTKLDWVALDHWNTDNPHVHLIVRGVAADGSDLVIHRDYIARGMRQRAAELVTLELGPQPEWEVRRKLATEVGAERWTRLDAALQRAAERTEGGVLDFRPEAGASLAHGDHGHRDLLVGRLQKLERMGLAHPLGPSRWRLAEEVEPTLREMGVRGDVIRTMQRALAREVARSDPDRGAAGYAVRDPADRGTVIGRVVEKGLDDELSGRAYLVVDGVDGRAHYVRLGGLAEIEDVPAGAIVTVGPARTRPADRAIADLAAGAGGVYDPERHRALLEHEGRHADPEAVVEGHVRRLEALRRAQGGGIAERLPDGRWKVPDDFATRAHAHDAKRGAAAGAEVRIHSELPVGRQVEARGATWLDRELVAREKAELAPTGFGWQVREALERRAEHLVGERLGRRQGQRTVFARDLLDTLRDRELADAAARVARETGLAHHQPAEGERVSGVYRRRLDLVSGRFALVEDGDRFALVPWRPVIERELGREVSGVVRGGSVSWAMGRQRGLDLG